MEVPSDQTWFHLSSLVSLVSDVLSADRSRGHWGQKGIGGLFSGTARWFGLVLPFMLDLSAVCVSSSKSGADFSPHLSPKIHSAISAVCLMALGAAGVEEDQGTVAEAESGQGLPAQVMLDM